MRGCYATPAAGLYTGSARSLARYIRQSPAHSSCATGAALPSSSKQRGRVSSVSGEKVLGAAVVLSDASVQPGPFVLSLSEALMWARTHGFSPLHNGKLLNPF